MVKRIAHYGYVDVSAIEAQISAKGVNRFQVIANAAAEMRAQRMLDQALENKKLEDRRKPDRGQIRVFSAISAKPTIDHTFTFDHD